MLRTSSSSSGERSKWRGGKAESCCRSSSGTLFLGSYWRTGNGLTPGNHLSHNHTQVLSRSWLMPFGSREAICSGLDAPAWLALLCMHVHDAGRALAQ